MTEKISVIVPVYNIADYLVRCLDSIMAQTYPNIEVITVNDGSTDNSGQVLDEYAGKHSNVKVIHQENRGVTSARLHGVTEAAGEWIGFVDGDDEIEPDMYERLINNAHTYDAQISHCGYKMYFTDGRIHHFHNTGLFTKQDRITALKELLSGSRIEPGLWNKLYHKDLFHNLVHDGIMPSEIRVNEDLLMNFYLFSEAETSVFDDWCPYHYMVRNTSVSHAKLNEHKIYDPIRVKEIICQKATSEIEEDAQCAYVNTCINTYNTLMFAGKAYRNDLQKVRHLLKQENEFFHLLGKKRALMAMLITKMPLLFKPIYGCYSQILQKNAYI